MRRYSMRRLLSGVMLSGVLIFTAGCDQIGAVDVAAPTVPAPTQDHAQTPPHAESKSLETLVAGETAPPELLPDPVAPVAQEGPDLPGDAALFPVFLNFCNVTLDEETMRALEIPSSPLSGLARVDRSRKRTATGGPAALYLNFDNTYIECLAAEGTPLGSSDVVFSVDRPADYTAMVERLSGRYPDRPSVELRTMSGDEREIKWFYTARLTDEGGMAAPGESSFETYLMTYHIEAFMMLHIPPREDQRLTRFAYLNAGVEDIGSSAVRDVIGAVVVVTPEEAERLDFLMSAAAYKKSTTEKGLRYDGPDFRLDVEVNASPPASRIQHLVLAMREQPETNEEYRVGTTTLRVGRDGLAVWSF